MSNYNKRHPNKNKTFAQYLLEAMESLTGKIERNESLMVTTLEILPDGTTKRTRQTLPSRSIFGRDGSESSEGESDY